MTVKNEQQGREGREGRRQRVPASTRSARTDANGKARDHGHAQRKAGIITVTVPQKIVCGSKRIGVVGAFEPPVTG